MSDYASRQAGYREPPQVVWDKEIDRIDRHCRAFIELSSWATLATADADGFPDVSPRGGEPGFVKVLDEHGLALPTGRATTASTACGTSWPTHGWR
jgi:predicted pyridoxine 5'-phosphate oxidase superfamily flavin-nucleotide-binding protein